MLRVRTVVVLAFVGALAGCTAGKDFVRPDSGSFKNGETTYAQVVEKLGQPFRESSSIKNDKTLKTARYAYAVGRAIGKPLHDGVTPVRVMVFTFYNDTVVGHLFLSSWAEDHTDFDESKVKNIVKGKTTRAEVTALMGRPGGYAIYPLIKASPGEAALYRYEEVRMAAYSAPKIFAKALTVEFDNAGVVTEVEFTSSGTQ